MIPKQIFFLWFGDNPPPKYAENVIKTFKEANPDFNIDLIRKSNKEIESPNINDDLLVRSVALAKECKETIKRLPFIIIVTNMYRKLIVNKYGGIYLDIDTFPIKPFDEYLLYKEFQATSYILSNKTKIVLDIFFIGGHKGCFNTVTLDEAEMLQWNSPAFAALLSPNKNAKFSIYHEAFFNGTLKYGNHVACPSFAYIDHYADYTHKKENNRVPLTSYDKGYR